MMVDLANLLEFLFVNKLKFAVLGAFFLALPAFGLQAAPNVVTSIKPVHSLVAGVMNGVGKPDLIVEGAGSPHTFAMKPSQAQKLEKADIVFWIGHDLETFLEKSIETIAGKAVSVELIKSHDLKLLKYREEGHDTHDHEAESKHEEHDHDDHDHDDHNHQGEYDTHIWLDPVNAIAMVHEIEETLVKQDPSNRSIYEANAHDVIHRLEKLTKDVHHQLEPVEKKPFVVFHDGYQYFEKRFHMKTAGALTVSPEVQPGVERIKKIQKQLEKESVRCVLAEPQFPPKLIKMIVSGKNVNVGTIDPLGAQLEEGPQLYFSLLQNMANSFSQCLGN